MKRNTNIEGIGLFLDTRRVLKNGLYPIKIRVCRNNKSYLFPTDVSTTEPNFNAALTQIKPKAEVRELRMKIDALQASAKKCFEELPTFTSELFRQKFYNLPTSTDKNLFSVFEQVIHETRNEGRIGTANSYQDAYRSFHAFHNGILKEHFESRKRGKSKPIAKKSFLSIENITPLWLKRYEHEMMKVGNSITSVAIRMRALRVILNRAIADKIVSPECYPFRRHQSDKNMYQIPTANNAKRALSSEQISAVMNAKNLTKPEEQARDLWLFSLFCNGLNFTDMLQLRQKDMNKDGDITVIHFHRQKTINKRNQTQITIALPPQIWQLVESILQKHGSPKGSQFLFPFIEQCKTPEDIKSKTGYIIRACNKYLKFVAQKAGVDLQISTYHARHSFASALKRSGAPVAMISDSLGHSNTVTTERYLSSFEQKQTADAVGKAFNFFNVPL